MSRFRRRLWKWTAALLATLLILLAIGVGLFRAAVPMVPQLRSEAEAFAEQALGWPVHIGEIDLQWALLGPELVLTDVQLLAPTNHAPLIVAERLDIVFGPLDLFQGGVKRPSLVRLHHPTLALERDESGQLLLSGFALPEQSDSRLDWRRVLDLALRHGRVTVVDAELHYRDRQRDIDDWLWLLPEVSLASNGSEHELEGSFLPPGALGEQVVFEFNVEGAPAHPEDWRWTVDMGARELKLNWWYQRFPWAGAAQLHGAVDFSIHLAGEGMTGMAGGGHLAFAELGLSPLEPGMSASATRFDHVALDWEFDYREGERFAAELKNLAIKSGETEFRDGGLALRTGGDYDIEAASARVPLAVLTQFAPFLPVGDDETNAWIRLRHELQLRAPSGALREFVIGVDRGLERYHLESRFADLAVNATGKQPGFKGLSGMLRADQTGGKLELSASDVRIDTAGLFRTPLPVARMSSRFQWHRTEKGWRVTGDDIIVSNPEAEVNANLVLDVPDTGSPVIDLHATARNVDFDARSTWLPVRVMPDKLVHWLDTAILAGHTPEATFVFQGPLQQYPFRDDSGIFDIRFNARDTAVKFAPDWPALTDLDALVNFHNEGLTITINSARSQGIKVVGGEARFEDFHDARIDISAKASADMADAWRYLDNSALSSHLEGVLENLVVAGPFDAKIGLTVPMHHVDEMLVDVDASLNGARVHPRALPWTVEALAGDVHVTRHGITAASLKGSLTGAPFAASIDSTPVEEGFANVAVTMQGHSPVAAFSGTVGDNWLQQLDGEFDWQGNLQIRANTPGLQMHFTSTLDGVESRLPAPLGNLFGARADLELDGAGHLQADLFATRHGAARLRFAKRPQEWRFTQGEIAMAAELPPELSDTGGLKISGKVPALDLGAWVALSRAGDAGDDAGGHAEGDSILQQVNLEMGRMQVGAIRLFEQRMDATHLDGAWNVALEGAAQGKLLVPPGKEPWELRLQHLHVPLAKEAETEDESTDAPDPRALPPLDLDVGDLRIGGVVLGHASGRLERTAIGYTTQGLVSRTANTQLKLDGRWEFVGGAHYTSVTGTLESTDLGATLHELGYTGSGIDADKASVRANLAWHASPAGFAAELLEGNTGFTFEDGSLSEVSAGASRLLGLLSIAALPRRLTLDFTDLFGKGLHFDTLSGEFLVTDGNAYTTNVVLKGPSVSALLVGRTGLAAHDYDQLAIVDPSVSSSLPVAGYLAAGPTVGTALLLLSQLLKAPLADITQVKYRITGSWDDPVIERVQDGKGRN